MKELFQDQYQFQTNKNNCGIDTSFILCDKKAVLNLFNNKKLLIQGIGSRLWRNSIFRDLTAKLTPYVPQPKQETPAIGDDDDVVYSHTDTPLKSHANNDDHTSPGHVKTACNKMIIKLRSPEMNESFASPSTPAVENKQVGTTSLMQKTQIAVDEKVTIVKTAQCPSTVTLEGIKDSTPKIMNYKQQLEKQFKENKQLQDSFEDIISQSKVLKNENERLQNQL